MSFSTALRLEDVDDYITPAQTCIKPVKIDTQRGQTKSIRIEQDGSYTAVTENGEKYTLKKAAISLNDCLACSGCITTAESVLVSQHSSNVLLEFLGRNREAQPNERRILVLSISPQSVASLAAELLESSVSKIARCFREWKASSLKGFAWSDIEFVHHFLIYYLYSIGAHAVLDTTWARDLALEESGNEFVSRFAASDDASHNIPQKLPVFCGICPGWVCYAEKTYDAANDGESVSRNSDCPSFSIVPHLSTVKSPQQILGRLLKRCHAESIYHVTVMPCFDRKLEASREEFSQPADSSSDHSRTPDVDLVLATTELVDILNETCWDSRRSQVFLSKDELATFWGGPPRLTPENQERLESIIQSFGGFLPDPYGLTTSAKPLSGELNMYRHQGSGSGGYAFSVFCFAASRLFGIQISDPLNDVHVLVRQLHNRDMQEMLLFSSAADRDVAQVAVSSLPNTRAPYRQSKSRVQPLLAFAVANGFRNIQSIVRPLRLLYRAKQNKTTGRSVNYPFDYVEVMACPAGCLNGGGQLKEDLEKVHEFYMNLPVNPLRLNAVSQALYLTVDNSDGEHKSLRTTYRQVPKIEIVNPSALHW
ncbi:unnamed protein product [Calicophoron daubneyi]|uniref:Iron hydrogenase large subunit C-terminal domain-containing protein n=1 Tax=Calicophoron daubneyi TaxID=300641 RepID=A0AAV2U054_CALDB